ncbi:MAG: hypothetical protein INR66_22805, partial [Gordonia polyisoprenivorans]|nr:hypothetical protein [Gordonia polyisoprenivorans]
EEAATAPAEEPTAPAEDETPAASSDGSASNGSTSDDRTIGEVGASKAKGFGLAAGKKRPGHRS